MDSYDTEQELIDHVCSRFELDWHRQMGLDWNRYLSLVDKRCRSRLVHDLIAMDIEFRLRQGHPEPPRCERYLEKFGSILSRDQAVSLTLKEFRFRQLWGNRPEFGGFVQRFPSYRCEIELGSREFLEQLEPVTLSVFERGRLMFQILLSGVVEIGRQRKGEPAPYATVDTDEYRRLVVVPKETTSVSRFHLRIQAVAYRKIRIWNLTTDKSIEVELSKSIEPQTSDVVTPPAVIDINAPMVIRLSGGVPRQSPADSETPATDDAAQIQKEAYDVK